MQSITPYHPSFINLTIHNSVCVLSLCNQSQSSSHRRDIATTKRASEKEKKLEKMTLLFFNNRKDT
jgi:hypothetical protein